MDKLQTAREIINKADKEMARLFKERMEAAKLVAEYKQEHGLPIYDQKREEEVINRNSLLVEDEEIRSYYVSFLKNVMDISKNYQHKLLEGAKIAYSGVEGAFAHIAAGKVFPTANLVSYRGFEDAYRSVAEGECDAAILPIENSYAGEVAQVTDLMFDGSLFVTGIYDLEITHNLLGVEGANIEDVKTVISHPQAISQCSAYIKEKRFETKEATNTAMAAQSVANSKDKSVAAIASKETAKLYGLKVLDHHINSSRTNTTRFAVFSKAENKIVSSDTTQFILLFTVNHEAGALAKAISIIGRYGFNMNALRSRPIKGKNWEYYFYVEASGDISGKIGELMLSELSEYCDTVKVAGKYSDEKILSE